MNDYKREENNHFISVQLFFANPGKIQDITAYEELKALDCVMDWGVNFNVGDTIKEIADATQRAGYVIITGRSENEICNNIETVFNHLYITDENDINLIIKGKRGNRK